MSKKNHAPNGETMQTFSFAIRLVPQKRVFKQAVGEKCLDEKWINKI